MGMIHRSSSSWVNQNVLFLVFLSCYIWYAVSDEMLPVSIDWRERGAVVHIKNQGTCGSCWAFSAIAAVEGLHKIKTGRLISLSEQELVDCVETWTWWPRRTNGCKGGFVEHGFDFIIKNGIKYEKHYPYKEKKSKCHKHTKYSDVVVDIGGYKFVPAYDEKALQRAVARQPVSVILEAEGDEFKNYISGVFNQSCGIIPTHGVVIVGYGTYENGQDYWIVKNSWGPEWGENGYMRIQRNIDHSAGKCGIATSPLYPTMESTAYSVENTVRFILSLMLFAMVIYGCYHFLVSSRIPRPRPRLRLRLIHLYILILMLLAVVIYRILGI